MVFPIHGPVDASHADARLYKLLADPKYVYPQTTGLKKDRLRIVWSRSLALLVPEGSQVTTRAHHRFSKCSHPTQLVIGVPKREGHNDVPFNLTFTIYPTHRGEPSVDGTLIPSYYHKLRQMSDTVVNRTSPWGVRLTAYDKRGNHRSVLGVSHPRWSMIVEVSSSNRRFGTKEWRAVHSIIHRCVVNVGFAEQDVVRLPMDVFNRKVPHGGVARELMRKARTFTRTNRSPGRMKKSVDEA